MLLLCENGHFFSGNFASHGAIYPPPLPNTIRVKEQSQLFDLFRAFDEIDSSVKSIIFYPESLILLHACTTFSDLTSNISTMILARLLQKK